MENKIALVTGGSRGLGKDMALSLAKKGINVILTYNTNREEAQKVVREIESNKLKAAAVQLDVADLSKQQDFFDNVGAVLSSWETDRIDFLINNAGTGATIPFMDVTEADFDRLTNIHLKGTYFLTQKALRIMNDNGGIVFISSGTTRYCVPGYSVYSPLKAAVEVLTKYIAKEMGGRGIRANVVAPGPIETDFNNAAIRNNPAMKQNLSNMTALGRVGNADDIGSVVAFLCTEDAKWINGQRIEVSGGLTL